MIDTPTMKLARAVYPNLEWTYGVSGLLHCVCDLYDSDIFDPLNNDAQAIDVLCWLLNTDALAHWELTTDGKQTAPSLRAAILAAALRVVGE